MRERYSKKISEGSEEFERYLQTINRQIKDIEKLVNEFSSFARMPRPIMKSLDINKLILRSFDLAKMSSKNKMNLQNISKETNIKGDEEQLNRVFINLLKNSEEALNEKRSKIRDFQGKINVEISSNNHYIVVSISDNGSGIPDIKKAMNPYYTTKLKGTGLGLPIVNKIISEHSGDLSIINNKNKEGLTIIIKLPKNYE